MRLQRLIVGPVQTNCYILENEEEHTAVVFDPGDRGDKIFQNVVEHDFHLVAVMLTHGHFDHITGVAELLRASDDAYGIPKGAAHAVPVYAGSEERELLSDSVLNCSGTGMGYGDGPVTVKPDVWLADHEKIELAGFQIECIHTPGHTEGSCCYYIEDEKLLFSGDTVFEGSVGRTDFPTGSSARLTESIRNKIVVLPDDTYILPGHGGETTVGNEKKWNMWFGM